MMRLDKFLSTAGKGTRTQVKQLIRSGKVLVNHQIVKNPEYQVLEETDEVVLSGERIHCEKSVCYLFHKPAGCVTAKEDRLYPTVMDYLPKELSRSYFPVGRLDRDTEGLLLITNDGALSHLLLSPSYHVPKTYYVETDLPLEEDMVPLFLTGVDIGDPKPTKPARLELLPVSGNGRQPDVHAAYITICEGRYHQVKRMFQAFGRKVRYLKRVSFGGLNLGELEKGAFRRLLPDEMEKLRQRGKKDGLCHEGNDTECK